MVGTSVIWRGAFGVIAVFLVRAIPAVVVVVADVILRNAVMIIAGEVMKGTSGIIAVVRLVRSVHAVLVQIAFPRFRNASFRRYASELIGGTFLFRASFRILVFGVLAVVIAVA